MRRAWGTLLLVLYGAAGTAAALLGAPYLLWRSLRHPREMKERLGWGEPAPAHGERAERPLWIHAASLGELEAARALLQDSARSLAPPLLLTVTSVSARTKAETLAPELRVFYAPLDLWFAAIPFFARQRPRGLILLETELWPLTLALCRARGIPVALVSGRLSPRKWARTRRLRVIFRPALGALDGCAVQSAGDAERFVSLGAREVRVTGNLKYRMDARVKTARSETNGAGRVRRSPLPPSAGFLFVAGSVRLGEEAAIDAAPRDCFTVIAPRHLRERERWLEACQSRGRAVVARSARPFEVPRLPEARDPEVRSAFRERLAAQWPVGEDGAPSLLLLDVHGELGSWFAAADAAFVGGTLVPIGGHNLFEPAREGIPVAFGPHTEGVADLAEPLLAQGGGTVVRDGAELSAWIRLMERDEGARQAAGEGARRAALHVAGAAERTWSFLFEREWTGVRGALPAPSGETGAWPGSSTGENPYSPGWARPSGGRP